MKEIVYLDVYFGLNFVMDLVSLLLSGVILSEKTRPIRLVTASAFGALVSSSLLLFSLPQGIVLLLGLASFFPMIAICYGMRSPRRFCFLALFSFVSSLFLGGAMQVISYYSGKSGSMTLGVFLAGILLAFGAYTLWGKRLKNRLESAVISLSIVHKEKEEQLYGLVDSGSFLKDPESGAPVILLKAEYAADLLSPSELVSLRFGTGEGIVPIPMRTASGTGCLFAFFPSAVNLHLPGKQKRSKGREKILIALDFSGGGYAGCPCLVPLSVI